VSATEAIRIVDTASTAATVLLVVAWAAIVACGWLLIEVRETRRELRVMKRLAKWRGDSLARANAVESAARREADELRGRLRATTKTPITAPRAPTLTPKGSP